MRKCSVILCAGIAAALLGGCGGSDGPYLSDVEVWTVPVDESPAPVEEARPAPEPVRAPPAQAAPLAPEAPVTQPSAPTRPAEAAEPVAPAQSAEPAPEAARMTAPAPSTAPTTAPTTSPSPVAPSDDLLGAFLRELGDIAAGQPGGEPGSLPGPATSEQRTLAAVLQAMTEFRDGLRRQTLRDSVPVLLDMADRIRSVAPLRIPSAALCSKVDGFGAYETIAPRFIAARQNSVVLYCEVSGFSSRLGDRGLWETRLMQEISLVDSSGEVVWTEGPNMVVDVCRSRRRDFYVGRVLRLPANVPAGRYVLQVQLTDQFSQEPAVATIEIEFVAEQR